VSDAAVLVLLRYRMPMRRRSQPAEPPEDEVCDEEEEEEEELLELLLELLLLLLSLELLDEELLELLELELLLWRRSRGRASPRYTRFGSSKPLSLLSLNSSLLQLQEVPPSCSWSKAAGSVLPLEEEPVDDDEEEPPLEPEPARRRCPAPAV
jgi:hypothetical protein